ncbi:uncharacterized protein SPAPADRAFT_149025 [Spathaspora passalidarum NRRL Y-27907]|uniref:Uncharacterized protein n=1 Tax=Spathaspora passalidarum (strain NRRL Y-27907 / 11-Y1) TaxID=619300 RepID=G3AI06_SPAPN|nr:uncharacterized protein SPAPADRAFT_149025 [Spathaspora passalidarum NRRL Y-27907]EGW34318.1 hypothetical protein SPAPADRAFT_149025 [Spathaspora passalidarum NRRL Y-27907]
MYAPSSFHIDLYSLWNGVSSHPTLIPNESNESKSNAEPQTRSTNNGVTTSDQRKHINNLFAPPLSAYSANYPGACSFQLEYTMRRGTQHNSKMFSITPSTQANIEQLDVIRNYGYNTIRPIGINKTMEEIEFENSGQFTVTDEQSYGAGVNNTGAENSGDQQDQQDNSNNTLLLGSNLNASGLTFQLGDESREVDLDAQILNADDLYSGAEDEDDDVDSEADTGFRTNLVDEGFMASEVEYQDDHSLNSEINSTYVVNSGGSSSLFNSNNASGRTIPTNPTTASAPGINNSYYMQRIHEEGHNENDPDYSELDMVVDEN